MTQTTKDQVLPILKSSSTAVKDPSAPSEIPKKTKKSSRGDLGPKSNAMKRVKTKVLPSKGLPKVRKTPVIRFDSSTSKLELSKTMTVDGEKVSTVPFAFDLSMYPEVERQRLIRLAKIVMNFANGQDVSKMSLESKGAQHSDDDKTQIVEVEISVSETVICTAD